MMRILYTYPRRVAFLFSILLALMSSDASRAQSSTIERIGDVSSVLLPVLGAGPSFLTGTEDHYRDFWSSSVAYGSTMWTTYMMKLSTQQTRPDSSDAQSFPSGHTCSAFSGATLIQMKYGSRYGIPAYLLAGFVGYSRVYADRHYVRDALVGALVGTSLTYLVYDRWTRPWRLTPEVGTTSLGFRFHYHL